jgi:hypothetical protein
MEKIHALQIHVDFIPQDSLIIGDSAELIMNGTIRKQFKILPQTNDARFSGAIPNDLGIYLYATNSSN